MLCGSVVITRTPNRSCFVSLRTLRPFSPTAAARRAGPTKRKNDERLLPSSPARTRFAPSPTGQMHLGSLRTALYNYLLAKATGGQFLLRIEDTDQKRIVPRSEAGILEDLRWAGLEWDEGPEKGGPYGPYRQSERLPIYKEHIRKLLASGHAYYCFCGSSDLDLNARQNAPTATAQTAVESPGRRGPCNQMDAQYVGELVDGGHSYTMRLRAPHRWPKFDDVAFGSKGGKPPEVKGFFEPPAGCKDPVLMKTDGYPTYHFANVVDDHLMRITHVIRASEWLISTPMHVYLHQAFGWEPPQYAHACLLTRDDKAPFHKRNMDASLAPHQEQGVVPEAMLNFLALLGWTHGSQNDKLDLQELINRFDLKFTKDNATLSFTKLSFLHAQHAEIHAGKQTLHFEHMADIVTRELQHQDRLKLGRIFVPEGRELREWVAMVLKEEARHFYPLNYFMLRTRSFFTEKTVQADQTLSHKMPPRKTSLEWNGPDDIGLFPLAIEHFRAIPDDAWHRGRLSEAVTALYDAVMRLNAGGGDPSDTAWPKKMKAKVLGQLRHGLVGSHPGPPLSVAMELLGKNATLARLEDRRDGWGVDENAGRR